MQSGDVGQRQSKPSAGATIGATLFGPLVGSDCGSVPFASFLCKRRYLLAFHRSLDADAFGFLEPAEPSNRSLARPPLGSIGLDQGPIRLAFSLDYSVARPDEHA